MQNSDNAPFKIPRIVERLPNFHVKKYSEITLTIHN